MVLDTCARPLSTQFIYVILLQITEITIDMNLYTNHSLHQKHTYVIKQLFNFPKWKKMLITSSVKFPLGMLKNHITPQEGEIDR